MGLGFGLNSGNVFAFEGVSSVVFCCGENEGAFIRGQGQGLGFSKLVAVGKVL